MWWEWEEKQGVGGKTRSEKLESMWGGDNKIQLNIKGTKWKPENWLWTKVFSFSHCLYDIFKFNNNTHRKEVVPTRKSQ